MNKIQRAAACALLLALSAAAAHAGIPAAGRSGDPARAEAALSGETEAVDASTRLADGCYAPDSFSYSGGTGRVRIECTQVTVSGGQAEATLVFSSPHYAYLKADGRSFEGVHAGESTSFVIPIALNREQRIIGMTTAMSVGHEIEYSICVGIAAADGGETGGSAGVETDENRFTQAFAIDRYPGGCALLRMQDGTQLLLLPEGAQLPQILPDAQQLTLPLKKIWISAADVRALISPLSLPDDALINVQTDSGEIDYAALLKGGCELAVLSAKELTEAELMQAADRLALLKIPCLIDRSSGEESAPARREWLRVYGLIFGMEAEAEAAIAAGEAESGEQEDGQ